MKGWEDLPEEMVLRCLGLPPWQFILSSLVCSRWYRLAHDDTLWRRAFEEELARGFGNHRDHHDDVTGAGTAGTTWPRPCTVASDQAAFVGLTALLSATASPRSVPLHWALERLWCPTPPPALPKREWFDKSTRENRPLPREGKNIFTEVCPLSDEVPSDCEEVLYLEGSPFQRNLEPWDPREVSPYEEDSQAEAKAPFFSWHGLLVRHAKLRARWLHGCEPSVRPVDRPPQNTILRVLVTGMKGSGKTAFLRSLAPDQDVEDEGVNVVTVSLLGVTLVLLEVRRPQGWRHYNGASVDGIMFMADQQDFAAFRGDGQAETENAYKRMEDTYKRFHGICGEAACVPFAAVVCATKVDLAGEDAKKELRDAVHLKLRVAQMSMFNWYHDAHATTIGTNALQPADCYTALKQLLWLNEAKAQQILQGVALGRAGVVAGA